MEFENLQIEIPTDDDNKEAVESALNPAWEKKYYNSSKGFVVGLDLASKEAIKRKESRAERFGMSSTIAEESSHLDPFLELDLKDMEFPQLSDAAFADKRPDALHLHGVSKMSTKDVFEYFKDHGPDTMEWIDDHSCNVVWETESMAKTAMAVMSRTFDELKGIGNASLSTESSDQTAKSVWRIAKPDKKARYLFLRPATIADKKLPGAAKRSLYYLIHGHGRGRRGGLVSSSRKRRIEQADKFLRERLTSKNPEVQFLSVNDSKSKDEVDEIMDIDVDSSSIPTKRLKGYNEKGKMYSDLSLDKGNFSRVNKEENLRIEVSNISSKWTSNKRNQHKRGGPSSNNESDEKDDDSDDDISLDENIAQESDRRKLPVTLYTKGKVDSEKQDDEDLRDQINTTDLRAKIESRNSQKSKQDLRTRLKQKRKHLGLSKEQLNLCIEVTEVSDED